MRKPVYAIWEQQRRRSACASAQSDQRLCYSLLIPPLSIAKISSLYLVSVAAQTSLTWSQTPKTGFSCDEAYFHYSDSFASVMS